MIDPIVKKLGYVNRDYDSIVEMLVKILPSYIPSINDAESATSVTRRFLSVIAGVVDILNGYLDLQYGETSLAQVKQLKNAINIAHILGFKLKGTASSSVNLSSLKSSRFSALSTLSFNLEIVSLTLILISETSCPCSSNLLR